MKGGSWAAIARLLKVVAALVLNVFLAKILTPGELGVYFLLLSFSTTLSMVARVGMGKAVMRLTAESIANNELKSIKKTIQISLLITLLGCGSVAFIYSAFSGHLADAFNVHFYETLSGAICIWVLFLALQKYLSDCLRGLRKIREAVFFDGVIYTLCTSMLMGIVYFFNIRVEFNDIVILSALVLSMVVAVGLFVVYKAAQDFPSGGSGDVSKVWAVGWPQMFANLAMYNLTESAILILGLYEKTENLALYGIALRMIVILKFSQFVVNSVVPPLIAELNATSKNDDLENMLRNCATIVAVIGAAMAVGYVVFGKDLIGFLFGADYIGAYYLLVILSLGQLVNLAVGSCGQVLMMTGHQKILMKISVVTLLVTVLASYYVVQIYGVIGIAVVYSLSIALQSMATLVIVKRRLGLWTFARLPSLDVLIGFIEIYRANKNGH
jgi:O-antigen/teichoic acid export membrane protein